VNMDKNELSYQQLLDENERLKNIVLDKNNVFSILSNIPSGNILDTNNHIFKLVFESAKIGLAILDNKGNYIECNPSLCQITGYSREEHLSLNFREITHPDDEHLDKKYLSEIMSGKINSFSFEKRYINKFGNIVWVNLMVNIIRDEKGQFINSVSATEDVTEQKKLKQVEDIIMGFNHDFDFMHIDEILKSGLQEAEKLTDSQIGFFHFIDEDKEEIELKFWSESTKNLCLVPNHIQKYAFSDAGVWIDCIKDKNPVIYNDYQKIAHKRGLPSGHVPLERILITPIIEDNRVYAILGLGNKKSDYTDIDLKIVNLLINNIWGIVRRKKAELKLIESEINFRNFFNSIADFLFVLDKNSCILEINQSPVEFLGFTRNELLGKEFLSLFHDENKLESKKTVQSILDGKAIKNYISLCSKSGMIIPVEYTISLGIWNKVEVIYLECKDISQLKFSEDKFSRVFHINPAICAIIDIETEKFLEINKTFYQKLKYMPEEVLNMNSADILRIDKQSKNYIYNEFYINKRLNNYEINLSAKDGNLIPVLLSGEIVSLQGKKYIYAVALDISDKKLTLEKLKLSEHQLQEAHQIAQIGHYVYDIDTGYWQNSKSLDEIFSIDESYIRDVKGWINIIHTDYQAEMTKYLQYNILTQHQNFDKEYKIVGIHDKLEKWVYGRGILKFDDIGHLIQMIGTIQDITKRKIAEIKIEESEIALKKIIKSTFGKSGQDFLDNMCLCLNQITQSDYTYIAESINKNIINTLSYYCQGTKIENVTYELSDTPCEKVFNKQSQVFGHDVTKLFPKDKLLKKLGIKAYAGTPVFNHSGHAIGIIVSLFKNAVNDSSFINSIVEICSTSVGSEIERTKSELKIRESERTLKAVFDNEPTMMLLLDEDANILSMNKAGENIFNYENNSILGIRNNGLMNCYVNKKAELDCGKHNECKNCVLCYTFLNTLKTGEPVYKFEAEFTSNLHKVEFIHTFLLSSSRVELDGKHKVMISIDDITDRKRMEQKLMENEFTLNKIFNNAPSIMLLIDRSMKINKMNKTASVLSLVWSNESENIYCGEVINCAHLLNNTNCIGDIISQTFKTGKEFLKEETEIISLQKKKMLLRTFLISSTLITNGTDKRVLLTLDEISERKKIDEELILSKEKALFNEQRYKLLSNIAFEGIMLHKDRVIVDANNALTKMSGYTYDELIGRQSMSFLFPPEYNSFLTQKLTEEYSEPYETVLLAKDGNRISVEIESRYFKYNNERIRVSAIRDITDRKLSEKKILQAIVQTEENERARFAQELHDGLGPILSNVQMYFQWLAEADNNMDFVIEKGNISLKNAFATLREISNNLSPHILHNFGIKHAISSFFETIALRNITIDFYTNIDKLRFDSNIEIAMYRVLTELINNSLKYSGATKISIEILHTNNFLKSKYCDNGRGFDVNDTLKNFKGFGMINIQNRIKAVQGNISFWSDESTGFKVEMEVGLL